MQLSVASILGDAGGAEAVVPVLKLLEQRKTLAGTWAAAPAQQVLSREGVQHRSLAEMTPDAMLELARPTLLLTGTSWADHPPELDYIQAALRAEVPVLSVVDFWSNYAARFLGSDGRLVLPDRIAVPDDVAAVEAVAEGLPAERVVATGNPYYEVLLKRGQGFDRDARLTFREQVGVSRKATLVLFASQPIRALYGDRMGYDEDQVVSLVRDGVGNVADWLGHGITLAIRSHPRQEGGARIPEGTSKVVVRRADEGDPLSWILAADLVVGMSSALLLQASLLGLRVVSVQPGLQGVDRLPSNRMGLSEGVFDAAGIGPALYRVLARPAHLGSAREMQRLRGHATGATLRLLDLAVEMGARDFSEVNA